MEKLKDIKEVLYGKETAAIINKFHDGLLLIEKNHTDYFSSRKSNRDKEKADRLHNHYMTYNNGRNYSFGFTKDSDLDNSIRLECIALFNEIFKQQDSQ